MLASMHMNVQLKYLCVTEYAYMLTHSVSLQGRLNVFICECGVHVCACVSVHVLRVWQCKSGCGCVPVHSAVSVTGSRVDF